MAATIRLNGIPITVPNAEDKVQAQQIVQEAAFRDPDEFTKRMRSAAQAAAPGAGLSEDDIEAIVRMSDPRLTMEDRFQGVHTPETSGGFEDFLIGAGRTFTSKARGAQQLVSQAADRADPSGSLRQSLGVRGMDELAAEEAQARRIFSQLDAGTGWEDAGELLGESLMFLGGGSLALGKRMLLGTAQGAIAGATAGRTDAESLAANTSVGAVMGGAGNAMVGGIKGALKLGSTAGVAAGNVISMLSAASRGNGFLFGAGASRFFLTNQIAANQMARAVGRGGTRRMPKEQMQQMHLARVARDQAAEIITHMKPRYQLHAAKEAADAAFERSVQTIEQANTALQRGFPVSREGAQQFNPSRFVQSLMSVPDDQLKKMGPYGRRLQDFRKFARAIEDMEGLEPQQVQRALNAVADNPEARQLLNTLFKTKKQELKRRILGQIVGSVATGPARAAGQLPGSVVPAGAERFGRDFGNAIFFGGQQQQAGE